MANLMVFIDPSTQQLTAAVGIAGAAVARRVTPTELIFIAARRFRSRYPSGRAILSLNTQSIK